MCGSLFSDHREGSGVSGCDIVWSGSVLSQPTCHFFVIFVEYNVPACAQALFLCTSTIFVHKHYFCAQALFLSEQCSKVLRSVFVVCSVLYNIYHLRQPGYIRYICFIDISSPMTGEWLSGSLGQEMWSLKWRLLKVVVIDCDSMREYSYTLTPLGLDIDVSVVINIAVVWHCVRMMTLWQVRCDRCMHCFICQMIIMVLDDQLPLVFLIVCKDLRRI